MRPIFNPLFLHFFDVHYLEEKGVRVNDPDVVQEAELAVRFALLGSDTVLVPAASYFESELCGPIIDRFSDVFELGLVWLVGGESRFEDFIISRLAIYREGDPQHAAYLRALDRDHRPPPWRSRHRSATEDLIDYWLAAPGRAHFPRSVFGREFDPPADFERVWSEVPERLQGSAFIVPYLAPHLLPAEANPLHVRRLHSLINPGYFGSYTYEFTAGIIDDLVRFNSPFVVPTYGLSLSYTSLLNALWRRDALSRVATAAPSELPLLREDPEVAVALLEALKVNERKGHDLVVVGGLPDQRELDELLEGVLSLELGHADAGRYNRAVAYLLERLFVASLRHPIVESTVDDGLARIDITFMNVARTGFFDWVHRRYGAPYGLIECKNYSQDLGNPEIAQLLQRMSPVRGHVGLLVHRSVADRARLFARCRAAAADRRFVLPISDDDLRELVALGPDPDGGQTQWLRRRLRDACGGA